MNYQRRGGFSVAPLLFAMLAAGLLAAGCGQDGRTSAATALPAASDSMPAAVAPDSVPVAEMAPAADVRGKIIFLHHSTGEVIWNGGVPEWFTRYNAEHGTNYQITEQAFPKDAPYGWENYPYDYWNIWVNHAGPEPFTEEPTLEMLTRQYEVIVLKHCFPVSDIGDDAEIPDISSSDKTLANYRLQYAALREKMRQFPQTKFVVWTGAAQVRAATNPESAGRAREFFAWVRDSWDEPGDNIFIWDFYALETEGGLYLKDSYAAGHDDAHPNAGFARRVAPLFCRRMVAVLTGEGDNHP